VSQGLKMQDKAILEAQVARPRQDIFTSNNVSQGLICPRQGNTGGSSSKTKIRHFHIKQCEPRLKNARQGNT